MERRGLSQPLGNSGMSRLVVVSNRVADLEAGAQAGGTRRSPSIPRSSESGGLWFGWDGNIVENGMPIDVPRTVSERRDDRDHPS